MVFYKKILYLIKELKRVSKTDIDNEENIKAEEEQTQDTANSSEDLWADAFDAAEEIESKQKEEVKVKVEPKEESIGETSSFVDSLRTQLDAKENQLKRLAADFENFRRRQVQEREDLFKYGQKDLILSLLPVVDNFERAITASKDAKDVTSVIEGIEKIQKQLIDAMQKNGVELIEALDKPFDPNFHEAVQQMVNDEKPDQTVINELQKGYTLSGRVIRPSMVVVSTVS